MSRRLALAFLAAGLALVGVAAPADAHPSERFTACAVASPTFTVCERRGIAVEHGATAYLRGRVSPAHPGFGEVWRRAPHSDRFVRVGVMGVNDQGKIRWSWVTDRDDVVDDVPYTFFFRVPGHGRSWATRVWVLDHQ